MQKKKAKYLVVDTTPFIQNAPLHEVAENVLTIADVIEEVRNKRQLRHLASLTYDLQVKGVFPESLAFVTEFAKKTGDYASLSKTDINLIALVYQLETEHVGRAHLRDTPVTRQFNPSGPGKRISSKEFQSNGLCLPTKINNKSGKKHVQRRRVKKNVETMGEDSSEHSDEFFSCGEAEDEEPFEVCDSENEYLDQDVESGSGESECEHGEDEENAEEVQEEEEDGEEEEDSDEQKDEEEEDESGWVTPSNFAHLRRNINGGNTEEKEITVGCMSTDFSVQNVLMQIGLNVVALDGRVITQLRTFVFRCYACFTITDNMKRVFCPKCGNKTLKRVSVLVDKDGNKYINVNFKRPLSTKGKRFSLPMPEVGKYAVNPRLVEDARRPHQKPSRVAKTKTNALHDDYLAGMSPFATRDVYSRSAQHGFNKGKPVAKYWMRRNPNESKRLPKS